MDDNKVSVTLASPAKIEGKREPAGTVVLVSAAVANHLYAARAIGTAPLVFDTSDTQTSADFDSEVALTAKMLADGIVAHAVTAAVAPIVAERDELIGKLAEAEEKLFEAEAHLENAAFDMASEQEKAIRNEVEAAAELDELRKRVPELEAALAEATKAGAAKAIKK
ncbi:hypothetical protein ASE04_27500 [Rhizobium sp. Root708]|uniref:hypothetical protein n=1 Tax=Rhizobium sp. Root708 TaxID=1736592 RepID=UPI0006F42772|nr:hypothetical protein [Rhizobium sp. Root708]KRB58462.1 hypothetical protein ASE04_27500 [Rhizobium sp. Root708]